MEATEFSHFLTSLFVLNILVSLIVDLSDVRYEQKMTRRAKEKRLERVQCKRKEEEEKYQRHLKLQSRTEWCDLLASIDKNEEISSSSSNVPTISTSVCTSSTKNNSRNQDPTSSSLLPPVSHLEWKSSNVSIAAADAFELVIGLETPTGTLHYEFSTVDYDIELESMYTCIYIYI
jgi:hypothetical protein